MSGFTFEEIEDILEGKLYNKLKQISPIIDFEFDPNRLKNKPGNCFISISKDRWNEAHRKELPWKDGNISILNHYNKCDLIITEEPIPQLINDVPQIIVKNSFASMRILAKAARHKMSNPVIGITGSVGKSSTRLILEHLLKDSHTIVATRGNHNTQSGVPLYGAKLCKNPDIGIIEISLNALNNRGNQSLTVRPNVCIVTSIGEAHLSTLYSTMNVARFKARIFAGLEENGLAIINKSINKEEFNLLYEQAKKRTTHIKTYSMNDCTADLFLKSKKQNKYNTSITFHYNNKDYKFEMELPSDGIVENALGAILCLAELGYDLESLLPKIDKFKSLKRVMELKQLKTKDGRCVDIIDDSHNAAIPSMINAIQTFKEKQQFYNGKKILVLGQVADLGEKSETLHHKLIPYILESHADYVFGHGQYMRRVIQNLPTKMVGGWFDNAQDLSTRVPYYCSDDSLIVLKGSVTGSDFSKTSHLLPANISRSVKGFDRPTPLLIAELLQPQWGMIAYDMKKRKTIFQHGNTHTQSIEGIGPILLLYLLLNKGIRYEEKCELNKWPTNRGKSMSGKPFKTGQIFTHRELIDELIQTQHPSAIFELAYLYFGSRKKAMQEISKLNEKINLKSSATLNLTGRYRVKEQQSFTLNDLLKTGIILSRYQIKLPVCLPDSHVNIRGIMFGRLQSYGILFVHNIVICISGIASKQGILHELKHLLKNKRYLSYLERRYIYNL